MAIDARGVFLGLTHAITYMREHDIAGSIVNGVAPGSVKTPQMVAQPADIVAGYEALIPSKRMARPEEIAATTVWLLSNEARYISGDIVEVDFAYLQAG